MKVVILFIREDLYKYILSEKYLFITLKALVIMYYEIFK